MNPGYHRIFGALRDLRTDWRWWLSFVLPVRMTSTYTCSCKGYGDLPVTERATWWQWRGRVFARAVEVVVREDSTPDEARELSRSAVLEFGEARRRKGER